MREPSESLSDCQRVAGKANSPVVNWRHLIVGYSFVRRREFS